MLQICDERVRSWCCKFATKTLINNQVNPNGRISAQPQRNACTSHSQQHPRRTTSKRRTPENDTRQQHHSHPIHQGFCRSHRMEPPATHPQPRRSNECSQLKRNYPLIASSPNKKPQWYTGVFNLTNLIYSL